WKNVAAEVWEYTLGGYPALKKWLSYRDKKVLGRDLRPEEARAFPEIARRIAAIIALGPKLDWNREAVKGKRETWGQTSPGRGLADACLGRRDGRWQATGCQPARGAVGQPRSALMRST
ncbi:MAG: hypothetical protein MUQ10_15015, partial [Anaerolineae bacterium]|nr:hypothetical protein [Anaerolineae bacterium]